MALPTTPPNSADAKPELPRAVAVVIAHEGRVLMIQRAPQRPLGGYWTPITGKLEADETLEAACHREVLEEVGLSIALGPVFHRGTTSDGRFDLTYFAATLTGGALRLQTDEVADARWVAPDAVVTLSPLLDTTRAVLAKHAAFVAVIAQGA